MAAKTLTRSAKTSSKTVAKVAKPASKKPVSAAAAKVAADKAIGKAAAAVKEAKAKPASRAKASAKDTARSYVAPEDALVIPTSGNGRFLVTATTYTNEETGVVYNNVAFMRGYENKDGEVIMTGKSGSLPLSMLTGAKGKKLVALIVEYLASFH
jgi:hypothetical protein